MNRTVSSPDSRSTSSQPPPGASPESAGAWESASSPLTADQVRFLEGLSAPPPLQRIDAFAAHDRLFLAGVTKRVRERAFEVLMLPEASLRLSELLRKGDRPIAEYVALISKDASLSIEVLRTANSAAYGGATTTSLHEAVMRVGLARLQSVLMLTLLKARVLKLGVLQGHADVCLELALPVGIVASQLARIARQPQDHCFMRGMLLHVEHLLILGLVTEIGREHRTNLAVSTEGILEAIGRFGPEIRATVAKAWNLTDILIATDQDADRTDYAAVRGAVIARWLGGSLPAVPGATADAVEAVTKGLHLRITPEVRPSEDALHETSQADRAWLDDFLRSKDSP